MHDVEQKEFRTVRPAPWNAISARNRYEQRHNALPSMAAKVGNAIGLATAYVRNFNLQREVNRATGRIRANPDRSLAGAAAAGFLIGVGIRRR